MSARSCPGEASGEKRGLIAAVTIYSVYLTVSFLSALHRVKGDVSYLKLSSQIGYQSFVNDVTRQASGPYTSLVWPLQGEDPDDAFSVVPYEKVLVSVHNSIHVG